MSTETQLEQRVAAAPSRGKRWLRLRARAAWRFLTARFSSSLTRRIVVLNLGGLVVLVVGFLLMDQFRADLIEARVQSLDDPGRHHCRRNLGFGDRGHRFDHARSGQAVATGARRKRRAVAKR